MRTIVVRLDNDGDVLLAGPAVRAVAAGSEHVALLCGPRGAHAARLLPGVDELHVRRAEWIDHEARLPERAELMAYVDRLAAIGADAAVILTSYHQSALPAALLLRLAGVPRIAAISEDFAGSLLDVRHHVSEHLHEVERNLSVAATLGFALPADDDGRLRVLAAPPGMALPARFVVVHPGASVPARAWAADAHRELVAALARRGWSVVVTGGPDERALTAHVTAGAGADGQRVVDVGGATSLAQLAGVLARAEAVVVANTGPAHLAAAVGTPVVSLFAPTVPAHRWRPWRVEHELLGVAVPCAGCRARACPVPGHPCLSGVGVDDVLAALERLAARVGTREAA